MLPPRECEVRILIADDFGEWRDRIGQILRSRPEWKIVGEACDGLEAVQKAADLRPHVVLLDIGMPNINGFEAAGKIRRDHPDTIVIFVTQNEDYELRDEALAIGALAYLLKTDAVRELVPAIEAALNGTNRRCGI